jgi:branched-chain amino acid transport system substrate-binding protein
LSYEAAQVLAVALQKTGGRADGLPQALTGIKNIKILSDTFSIDKYGDAIRPIHLGIIHNGKYLDIKSMKTTGP